MSKGGTGIVRKVIGSSRLPGSWNNFLRLKKKNLVIRVSNQVIPKL